MYIMHENGPPLINRSLLISYPFELDPQIIHHIIYSQAGSVGKALIELIMNSVGAGAVIIDITPEGVFCRYDGRRFTSYDNVKRYLGRFGTPHQEGGASYGRLRLGRGQLKAHARTIWCSVIKTFRHS